MLWEKHHRRTLPKGHVLKCIDGDTTNTHPSNWECVERGVVSRLQKAQVQGCASRPEANHHSRGEAGARTKRRKATMWQAWSPASCSAQYHFLLGLGMAVLADLMHGMKEGSEGRFLYETAASPAPGVVASLPNVMVQINDILNKLKRFSDS
jgi:hypothetical protein